MAIIKRNNKIYSFTIAWPLVLLGFFVVIGFGLPIVSAIRSMFAN